LSQSVFKEAAIDSGNSFLQRDLWRPAHRRQSRRIHELARGSVGLARIGAYLAGEADYVHHHPREFADRDIAAAADIDMHLRAVTLHEEDQRVGEIVYVQELASRRARAPDR